MLFCIRILAVALLTSGLAGCASPEPVIEGLAADVRHLTGARTRAVWVQVEGADPRAVRDDFALMAFDTDDGRGARAVLEERGSYLKPMLTSTGDRIVFSRRAGSADDMEVFVVGWDGSGLRRLASGFALATWSDPSDGAEWVHVGTGHEDSTYATVTRHRLDDVSVAEPVWSETRVGAFTVSADGRQAAGSFPWPHAGIADLAEGAWQKLGQGCWTDLAPASVPLFWYFDGSHRNVLLVNTESGRRWTASIAGAPGFEGAEVYYPRWTNHARFFAVIGPYNQGGRNQARTGGTQTEVWIGRFSADYTRVEAWARVTDDSWGDSYPDVWIEPDRSPHAMMPRGFIGPAPGVVESGTAPAGERDAGRVVVQARLVEPAPIPTPASILPYRNALVVNAYDVVAVMEGRHRGRRILVAQWAIRDGEVLPEASKEIRAEHVLAVELYDAHPELEGERLIQQGEDNRLPLYYDVGH
jgi:hypothetical protein